jgi:hypothetical protein
MFIVIDVDQISVDQHKCVLENACCRISASDDIN